MTSKKRSFAESQGRDRAVHGWPNWPYTQYIISPCYDVCNHQKDNCCRRNSTRQPQAQNPQASLLAQKCQPPDLSPPNAGIAAHPKLHRTAFDLEEGLRPFAPSPTAMPSPHPKSEDGFRIEAVWNLGAPARHPSAALGSRVNHPEYEDSRASHAAADAATSPERPHSKRMQDPFEDLLDLNGISQLQRRACMQ